MPSTSGNEESSTAVSGEVWRIGPRRSGLHHVQQGGVVADGPVLHDQTIGKPEDVDLRPRNEVAVDRQAFEPRATVADVPAVDGEPVITVSSECVTRCSSTLRSAKLTSSHVLTTSKMPSPRVWLTLS